MSHPSIDQFKQALNAQQMTSEKITNFEKWINGKKFSGVAPEEQEEARQLLAQAQERGVDAPTPHTSVYSSAGRNRRYGGGRQQGMRQHQTSQPNPGSNANAASPAIIGEPFHNPYSFVPFVRESPDRNTPTPHTADETDPQRFTGVLHLKVRTLSPLMTSAAEERVAGNSGNHKTYDALTIGNDIILPATGVRGALRSLMTIVSGGTLSHLDEKLWLCQGRDANLGPAGKSSGTGTPTNVFLARVVKPGSSISSGTVQLGKTELEKWDKLGQQYTTDQRPKNGNVPALPLYCGKEVKLSGPPIGSGKKSEGLFSPIGSVIELPAELWAAYEGRNRHGEFPQLKKGWLVWLEPKVVGATEIKSASDVKSIQWARLGRHGQSLHETIKQHHPHLLPNYLRNDGKVDMVTDLFGQVPPDGGDAPIFAGRIRPTNVVFANATQSTETITLAPLSAPHPGCIAFYRANDNPDYISQQNPMRGYKVYRTTTERGAEAPWHYETQPVYKKTKAEPPKTNVNTTRQLLKEGVEGNLELALHALSAAELSLLLHVCSVDWRLGGGKPLGLGHCQVLLAELVDEFGNPVEWEKHKQELPQTMRQNLELWKKAQTPVSKLRYPRATKPASEPTNATKAGHIWFTRHAAPRMSDKGINPGLQTIWTDGELQEKADGNTQIAAQLLPALELAPEDVLYGYDCNADEVTMRDKRTLVSKLATDIPGSSTRDGGDGRNTSQNRGTRQQTRQYR